MTIKQKFNCNYGNLQNEMIRDNTVLGIRDRKLSERIEAGLTLEKAITTVRHSETVKKQQNILRQDTFGTTEALIRAVSKHYVQRPQKTSS